MGNVDKRLIFNPPNTYYVNVTYSTIMKYNQYNYTIL